MKQTSILRDFWQNFIDSLNQNVSQKTAEIERAIGFARLREQLWDALDNSEQAAAGWAYPIDIFVGDDGSSLFSIVTQNGKLFQVPMTILDENLSLGEWQQVTEVFQPVEQSRFLIKRQKDGSHRWMGVVATSVINRVGEIDSSSLFDSFIEDWQDTGDAPRVDFYHLGSADPDVWEFGTADYLAREGCCYIASGTFDEDHPLAKATIRAYNKDSDVWGWSIEFFSKAEPEILVLDPEVQVPIYKAGKNTRISVVEEEDAAGLFTRIGITEEKTRMKRDIEEKLKELFGDDEEGLASFLENVESVNRTVKDDKLIHRASKKRDVEAEAETEETENETEEEGDAQEEEGEEETELVLDDEAIAQIAEQVLSNDKFTAIQQSLDTLQKTLEQLTTVAEESKEEVSRLKKTNNKLAKRLEAIEADETEKKQTWAEDLPRKRAIHASYRPKDAHAKDEDEDEDEDGEDMARIATENLKKLPSY